MLWVTFTRSKLELRIYRSKVGGNVIIALTKNGEQDSHIGINLTSLGFKFNEARKLWYRFSAGLNVKDVMTAFPNDAELTNIPSDLVLLTDNREVKNDSSTISTTATDPQSNSARRIIDAGTPPNDTAGGFNTESPDADQHGVRPATQPSDATGGVPEQDGRSDGGQDGGITNGTEQPAIVKGDDEEHGNARSTTQRSDGTGSQRTAPESEARSPRLEGEKAPITLQENYKKELRTSNRPSTKGDRFNANVEVLTALDAYPKDKQLLASEADMLLAYSGWGGLLDVMEQGDRQEALETFLDPQALLRAKESALTAYYTPPEVVEDIWQCLLSMGYKGGRVLEPSAGTGIFLNHRPSDLDDKQHFTAVEMDPMAARILALTNPKATVLDQEFQNAALGTGQFDLVIGNVPFGEIKVIDPTSSKSRSIHNFFLKHSLDMCRDDGIVAIVTSTWTLDSKTTAFREEIAEVADLMAAVRMPGSVFSSTQTDTMSDLLIFRQRGPLAEQRGLPFIDLESTALPVHNNEITINKGLKTEASYSTTAPVTTNEAFSHGGVFAGNLTAKLSRFGTHCNMVISGDLDNVKQSIQQCADNIEEALFDEKNTFIEKGKYSSEALNFTFTVVDKPCVGSLVVEDNNVSVITAYNEFVNEEGSRVFGITTAPAKVPKTQLNRVLGLVILRKNVMHLLKQETEQSEDSELDVIRHELNNTYDRFVASHGYINEVANRKWVIKDALGPILLGLEHYDVDKKIATKSDIFERKVITEAKEVTSTDSLIAAVSISFSKHGHVSTQKIEELMSCSIEDAISLEPDVLLLDPETGRLQLRDIVLSGNVRKRLGKAQALLKEDINYARTVKSLEQVIPTKIEAAGIGVGLASTWVPAKYLEEFAEHQYGTHGINVEDITVKIDKGMMGDVTIDVRRSSDVSWMLMNRVDNELLGTKHRNYIQIFEAAMLNKPIRVTVKIEGEVTELKDASLDANNKLEALKDAFAGWVWHNDERKEALETIYNDRFNAFHAEPTSITDYHFSGLSALWQPRAHQTEFVIRALMHGNSMAAHCVGAGKTMEMVMLQIEKKRLGIANKPAIAVPNNMLYQIAQEANSMYPNARIAMISSKDLEKTNRAAMLARIAMNEWDLVVLTHGVLSRIPVPIKFQLNFEADELDTLRAALSDPMTKTSSRRIQVSLKNRRNKIQRLQVLAESKAEVLSWDMINIDAIAVDEAHLFKNLELDTTTSLPGVSAFASNRAWDLYMKSKYLMSIHNGKEKGLDFFTGTPISNTIAELYTMTRFVKPSLLEDMGISNFNDWVGAFGEIVTDLEMLPEGGGFHIKSRLSRFKNVPELVTSFRMFADIKTREDLQLPVPKIIEIASVAPQSPWQSLYMEDLTIRAKRVRGGSIDPSDDNLLKIINDGRRSAMDMRLVEKVLPFEDDTKLAQATVNLLEVYEATHDVSGAQIIFCDLSSPKKEGVYDVYNDMKDRLLAGGVSEEQIAFIHDAKNDVEKFALFSRVKSGSIRFLMGSTAKMGVGTNVQDRLAAIHELDAPWKPADIEQRLGRIVRQGNSFKSVKIFRYTTEDSFDLFMWETNKRKAQFISQIMRDPKKSNRDLSEDTEINFAEVVAITTGNPVIKEKVEVDSKVTKLARRQASFYAEVSNKEKNITMAKRDLDEGQLFEANLTKDITQIKAHLDNSSQNAPFAILISGHLPSIQNGDTTWLDRQGAATALQCALDMHAVVMKGKQEHAIGSFMGVDLSVTKNSFNETVIAPDLKSGLKSVRAKVPHVTLQRLTLIFESKLISQLRQAKVTNQHTKGYLDALNESPGELTFSGDDELKGLQRRQEEINTELASVLNEESAVGDMSAYESQLEQYKNGVTIEANDAIIKTSNIHDMKNVYEEVGHNELYP